MESISNLNYLQILSEPIMSLYNVKSPNDILSRLPDIFVKFIFIFEESPCYNKWQSTVVKLYYNNRFYNGRNDLYCRSDMNRLYEYLGNQIVYICRKTIKMSELFSGNTENVLDKLKISMNCCENYISVYKKVFITILYQSMPENIIQCTIFKFLRLFKFIIPKTTDNGPWKPKTCICFWTGVEMYTIYANQ